MARQIIKFTFISLFIWGMIFTFGPLVVNKINNISGGNQTASAIEAINYESELNIPIQNEVESTPMPLVEDIIATPNVETTANINPQTDTILNKVDVKKVEKVASFECPTPNTKYEDMSQINIGQKTGLNDKTYIPKKLQELNLILGTKKELCLTGDTVSAFGNLTKAASKEGLIIKASSTFRSYDTQKALLEADLQYTKESTSISTAKPGYSEHQLGTTIDITGSSIDFIPANDNFDNTPEDVWLKKNSYLYGFIQSYPKGKENITGYKYEPWHYRYIGIPRAKDAFDSGLTLTEFL